jgi:hypothetical protein
MKKNALVLIVLLGAILLNACGGTSEAAPTNTPEPPPEAADTEAPPPPEPTDTPEPVMMPVSMVSAPLGEGEFNQYRVSLPGFQPLDFEEGDLPAAPGSVTANWFTSGGFYVVGYYGLDLAASGPLCPGNSIMSGGAFQNVTNAPTEEGACEGFPTLTDDPDVGPVACHGTLFYRTAIPSNLQGTLFGTLEMLDADGNLVGITSQAESSPEMLEIDLGELCQ